MKTKTLQIIWHCKEPVFSLDFSPANPQLFATGGGDKDIKLWEVKLESDGFPGVNYVGSFGGLPTAVNVVRFSPLGDTLASGGDGGEVLLWRPAEPGTSKAAFGADSDERPVSWKMGASLRGHAGDVHDLAWSPDGSALLSGSVENIAVLWDAEARRGVARLEGHQHYVQGVAWDPLGWNLISLSNDRTARVYGVKPPALNKKCQGPPASSAAMLKEFILHSNLNRRSMPDNNDAAGPQPAVPIQPTAANNNNTTATNTTAAAGAGVGAGAGAPQTAGAAAAAAPPPPPPPVMPAPPARHPLFQDENMGSFFRRPAWSPDGSFVVLPAGLFKADPTSQAIPTSYIFARGDWSAPVAHLPSLGKPSVAVRFSPVLYKLREGEQQQQQQSGSNSSGLPWELLPYRMVWAIATLDSVMIYDTQSLEPIALLGGLHMAYITDLAWSSDGTTLAVSSTDGYCSLARFEPDDLGEVLPASDLPPKVAACITHAPAMRFAEKTGKQQAIALAAAKSAELQAGAPPLQQRGSPTGQPADTKEAGLVSPRATPSSRLHNHNPASNHATNLERTPKQQHAGHMVIELDADEHPSDAAMAATHAAQTTPGNVGMSTPTTRGNEAVNKVATPSTVGITPAGVRPVAGGARRIVPQAVVPSPAGTGLTAASAASSPAPASTAKQTNTQQQQQQTTQPETSSATTTAAANKRARRIAPVPVQQDAGATHNQSVQGDGSEVTGANTVGGNPGNGTGGRTEPVQQPLEVQQKRRISPVPATSDRPAKTTAGRVSPLPAEPQAPAATPEPAKEVLQTPNKEEAQDAPRPKPKSSLAMLAAMAGRKASSVPGDNQGQPAPKKARCD